MSKQSIINSGFVSSYIGDYDMSFPYYSDLRFGNEQASADSLGRLSFGESVDNKDYNYKTVNFSVANYSPAPEFYYYIEPTPNLEEVKREMYTALNNANFYITVASSGKGYSCTLNIRYNTGGEYNYFAQNVVSSYTGYFGTLTIPSTTTLTLNRSLAETPSSFTAIASLSLQLKNASDDTNVSDSTLIISSSVSSHPLIKIPV